MRAFLKLIPLLLAGCMPTSGSTEQGYTENGDRYSKAGVKWHLGEAPQQRPDPNEPLQPLPPDVQQQLRQ
jgi:hypothetical protein